MKVLKSDREYEDALVEIDELIELDPDKNTSEGDRLEYLGLLVKDYENRHFNILPPDPVDAIKFRMEQQNLRQRDLIPILGSRSKVSEILARKRPLTLRMIQALHSTLGIPAEILIQEIDVQEPIDWTRFPIKEMVQHGWLDASVKEVKANVESYLKEFLAPAKPQVVLYRKTKNIRSERANDDYALVAWTARVLRKSEEQIPSNKYRSGSVDESFMREVVKLSILDDAPLKVRDFLRANGIVLVIEPHLTRTHLDGAALVSKSGYPVIGLTLRYDRLDNFWFALMHELAHVSMHLDPNEQFYDDFELTYLTDPREQAADDLAREILIPGEVWHNSPASKLKSSTAAQQLARKLEVHPAIVAGRMRYEFNAYRLFNNLVGHNEVRKHFTEVNWS